MSRQSQAVNLDWLLPMPGLGLTEASCCLSESIYKVVKLASRLAIHMEKPLLTAVNWVGWSLRGSPRWVKPC